jgi:preprotein translocase subunit SecA
MLGFISKLFGGSKSQKDVKQLLPIVEKTNQYFQQYQSLSNDELRGKTVEFRQRIAAHLSDVDTEIEALGKEAEALPAEDISGRDSIFQAIDKLKKTRDQKIEEALTDIQADSFALVIETARRFAVTTVLISSESYLDRDLIVR